MIVCHHIFYFGFVNENKDIFFQMTIFGNVRISTAISPEPIQIFRIFQTYDLLSNDRTMNVVIIHVSKISLSRSCLFIFSIACNKGYRPVFYRQEGAVHTYIVNKFYNFLCQKQNMQIGKFYSRYIYLLYFLMQGCHVVYF